MEVAGKMRVAKEALELVGSIQAFDDDSQAKREVLGALGLNHVLKRKELEIKPEFPFSELPQDPKYDHRDLSPIEPENSQAGKGLNGAFNSACLSLVPDVYDVRTKLLKISLDGIWKKLDPNSPVFERFPFDRNKPVVPGRKRGMKGRFSPIPRV